MPLAPHSAALPSSPVIRAILEPRSTATQHMILEDVKCCNCPRTSQIPASGSRQYFNASLTCLSKISQMRLSRRLAALK